MPTPRHKLIHNPIPTSLFLSSSQCISCSQFNVKMFFLCLMHSQQTNEIQNRDVGMGLWMSLCLGVGIFLFPFFFMHWHPYIPLHFIEMILPLVYFALADQRHCWCLKVIIVTCVGGSKAPCIPYFVYCRKRALWQILNVTKVLVHERRKSPVDNKSIGSRKKKEPSWQLGQHFSFKNSDSTTIA